MSSVEVDNRKVAEILTLVQRICATPSEGMVTLLGAIHFLDRAYREDTTSEDFIAQTVAVLRQFEHGTLQ